MIFFSILKCFFQHEDCPGLSDACDSLPCGQKCLYNFTSFDEDTLVATHQTPKHRFTLVRPQQFWCLYYFRFIDDLSMVFTDDNNKDGTLCSVEATSESRLWWADLISVVDKQWWALCWEMCFIKQRIRFIFLSLLLQDNLLLKKGKVTSSEKEIFYC